MFATVGIPRPRTGRLVLAAVRGRGPPPPPHPRRVRLPASIPTPSWSWATRARPGTTPLPELFLIQSVDNDIRCDGSDASNYAPFAATLTDELKKITVGAPKAKILIVSSPWATVDNYGRVAARLPGPRAANSGTGPCDLFDPSGKPVPAHRRSRGDDPALSR